MLTEFHFSSFGMEPIGVDSKSSEKITALLSTTGLSFVVVSNELKFVSEEPNELLEDIL